MVLEHLHDHSSFVQLRRVPSCLVLDQDMVTTTKGGEAAGVLVPSGSSKGLSLLQGLVSGMGLG